LLTLAVCLVLAACNSSSSASLEGEPGAATPEGQVARLAPSGWSRPAAMARARSGHTVTLLPMGRVLVVGGEDAGGVLSQAEVFDPATGAWTATASMTTARAGHTATVLPSGRVLVVGGRGTSGSVLASAEVYDPAAGTWASTGSLATARSDHTATLLFSGLVFVAGGTGGSGSLASAEIFDPDSGRWFAPSGGSMAQARAHATAALLPSGRVLIAGGFSAGNPVASAEVYDYVSDRWSAGGTLSQARHGHTMTLLASGRVLVTGGVNADSRLTSSELYDPAANTWSATGALSQGRAFHSATLLPSGRLLVASGEGAGGTALDSAELYDPATGTWALTVPLAQTRTLHSAVLLASGRVLVVGGTGPSGPMPSTELYEPGAASWARISAIPGGRWGHRATLLATGRVLVTGGAGNTGYVAATHLYDPVQGSWTATGSLARGRYFHSMTLLASGRVLVAGGEGNGGPLTSAEVYDPASGLWSSTGALAAARDGHTATLLPSGRVLVVGGRNGNTRLAGAELYDPATGTWSATGALAAARSAHTATLLPSGRVLVVGGYAGGSALASAELYDPATGTWSATSPLSEGRYEHTATLLPSGKVLVVGGNGTSSRMASAELYDPATGTWSTAGSLSQGRYAHTATLLPSGRVLVASGATGTAASVNEVYDPATGAWADTAVAIEDRYYHAASLLPSGRVLVVGGFRDVASAEVYDDTGASAASRPVVDGLSPGSSLEVGRDFSVVGSRLRGVSEASGGSSRASSTGFPLVSLLGLEGSRLVWLPIRSLGNFSSVSVNVRVPALPPGPYLAFATVNGMSDGTVLNIISDVTPPDTEIFGGVPASVSRVDSARFTFRSTEAGSTFECRLDEATFSPCTSPTDYLSLAEGSRRFEVRARDAAGNVDPTPDFHEWRIDVTAPDTTLLSMPPVLSNENRATFTFASNDAGARFECNLYGFFSPCTSPATFTFLSESAYTFLVRAVDDAGNADATPASYSWSVDLTAPESHFIEVPPALNNLTTVAFSFAANEAGVSFECSLDEAVFISCPSPAVLGSITEGTHIFRVRARDAAGQVEAEPSSYIWRTDLRPPETHLVLRPPNPSGETVALFTYSANEQDVIFECRLDGTAFAPCPFSITIPSLTEGLHRFEVRARDAAGNVDATPEAFEWIVDVTLPAAPVITSPSDGATGVDGLVTFTGTAEPGSTVRLSLDGAVLGTASTSEAGTWSFTPTSPLADGVHTVTAQASDASGTSAPSAPVRFTVGEPVPPPASGGCGCGAGTGDASWMLAGLALLGGAVRRRRPLA
jgi:MYXO-CTERM domain-containing protein